MKEWREAGWKGRGNDSKRIRIMKVKKKGRASEGGAAE